LVALLVVVAILLLLYVRIAIPIAKTGQQVKPHVQQLAGTDENGTRVALTYELKAVPGRGLKVIDMAPSSAMRRFYGLEKGDLIIVVHARGGVPMTIKETDADTLKAYVEEAYQVKQPLIVERKGKQITLPVEHKPGDVPKTESDPVKDQLDALQHQGR
jgi:hypothetical protein